MMQQGSHDVDDDVGQQPQAPAGADQAQQRRAPPPPQQQPAHLAPPPQHHQQHQHQQQRTILRTFRDMFSWRTVADAAAAAPDTAGRVDAARAAEPPDVSTAGARAAPWPELLLPSTDVAPAPAAAGDDRAGYTAAVAAAVDAAGHVTSACRKHTVPAHDDDGRIMPLTASAAATRDQLQPLEPSASGDTPLPPSWRWTGGEDEPQPDASCAMFVHGTRSPYASSPGAAASRERPAAAPTAASARPAARQAAASAHGEAAACPPAQACPGAAEAAQRPCASSAQLHMQHQGQDCTDEAAAGVSVPQGLPPGPPKHVLLADAAADAPTDERAQHEEAAGLPGPAAPCSTAPAGGSAAGSAGFNSCAAEVAALLGLATPAVVPPPAGADAGISQQGLEAEAALVARVAAAAVAAVVAGAAAHGEAALAAAGQPSSSHAGADMGPDDSVATTEVLTPGEPDSALQDTAATQTPAAPSTTMTTAAARGADSGLAAAVAAAVAACAGAAHAGEARAAPAAATASMPTGLSSPLMLQPGAGDAALATVSQLVSQLCPQLPPPTSPVQDFAWRPPSAQVRPPPSGGPPPPRHASAAGGSSEAWQQQQQVSGQASEEEALSNVVAGCSTGCLTAAGQQAILYDIQPRFTADELDCLLQQLGAEAAATPGGVAQPPGCGSCAEQSGGGGAMTGGHGGSSSLMKRAAAAAGESPRIERRVMPRSDPSAQLATSGMHAGTSGPPGDAGLLFEQQQHRGLRRGYCCALAVLGLDVGALLAAAAAEGAREHPQQQRD